MSYPSDSDSLYLNQLVHKENSIEVTPRVLLLVPERNG